MKRFLNKAYTQLEKYLIYLLFSSKCWTWTKFVRLLSGYQKNTLSLPKHGNITSNSVTKTREKWDFFTFSLPDFRMIRRCLGIQCVSFFCLEPTVKKDTLMRMTSVTVMITFSKVTIWELLDHSYVQSSFSTSTRYINNSILKETLRFKILQTLINIHANSFIKTWVNIMKCKSIKVFGLLSVAQKSHPALRRTLHKNRWHFTYFHTHLFLSNKGSF